MANQFVKMEKDGVVIEVHPDALKNHLELGWKEVVEEPKKPAKVEKEEK